jgi:hypothetical protein
MVSVIGLLLATTCSMSRKSRSNATRLAVTLTPSGPKAEPGSRQPSVSAAVLPEWMRMPQSSIWLLPKRMAAPGMLTSSGSRRWKRLLIVTRTR